MGCVRCAPPQNVVNDELCAIFEREFSEQLLQEPASLQPLSPQGSNSTSKSPKAQLVTKDEGGK